MRREREIYGWKYIYDKDGFEIIPNETIEKPRVLYKLYGLNQYSFDSLINQYIYATHPSQLNDIFDCNEELLSFDDMEAVKAFLKNAISQEEIDKIIESEPDNLKKFVQRNFRELAYRKWGVFSLTSEPNNILMWSYYSNHSGFCIEFDLHHFPFKFYGPFPINYQSRLEALSINKVGVHVGVLAQSNLKDKIWEHENEWRLMVAAPEGKDMFSPNFKILKDLGVHNRKFSYPIEAIKSIALGNRFFIPDEISEINSTSLKINLMDNFEQKSIMLDFLATNNITTHIALRQGFTEIKYRAAKIERIKYKKYKINAC